MNIQSIWRFPIKSFQGDSVPSAFLNEAGIFGDRVLALREKSSGKILSGKHKILGERILEFTASYDGDPVPGQPLPPVRLHDGDTGFEAAQRAQVDAYMSAQLGTDVELVTADGSAAKYDIYWLDQDFLPLQDFDMEFDLGVAEAGSFADLEPLHILTTASLAHLATLAPDSRIEVGRFRPSLMIDSGDATGFIENDWNGRSATLGSARITFGEVAPRCNMVTRPQGDLPRDVGVLKTIAQQNSQEFMGMNMPCLGCYARVDKPGEIRVGDALVFD